MAKAGVTEWSAESRRRIRRQIKSLAATLLDRDRMDNPGRKGRHPGDKGLGLLAEEVVRHLPRSGGRSVQLVSVKKQVHSWVRDKDPAIPSGEMLLALGGAAGSLDWLLRGQSASPPPSDIPTAHELLVDHIVKEIEEGPGFMEIVRREHLDVLDPDNAVWDYAVARLRELLSLNMMVATAREYLFNVALDVALERLRAQAITELVAIKRSALPGSRKTRTPTPGEQEAHARSYERQTGKRPPGARGRRR